MDHYLYMMLLALILTTLLHQRLWSPVFSSRTFPQYQKMSPSRYQGVQHATEEEQRAITNSSRKKEVVRQKWKWHSIVDVSSGESQVQWCKEQYCKGNWNVRSMKLDMVKQEMARVNPDILRISELKWMGMGEFNSGDRYIYCEQESLTRTGVSLIVNKRVQDSVLECSLKMTVI